MVIMDASVVNVALPSIASGLRSTISGLQWVVAGYAMTFSCFLLLSGHLSDHIGAKKTLITGLILFLAASLACGLSSDIFILILSRLLQGAAAATLVPSSLALINTSYENKRERARAIGIWGGMGGIAAASGPVFGALLISQLGWPSIFFINIPIGLITIFLITKYVKKTASQISHSFDFIGQLVGIIMVASLAFTLINLGHVCWVSSTIIIPFIIFIISVIFFILIERRLQHPMFPLYFFKLKNFAISIISGMIINIGLYGALFILPLYFQKIRGYSIIMTGFAVLPLLVLAALSSYLSGKLTSHKGAKLPMCLGFVVGILGFFSLLIIGSHTPSYYLLILPLAAIGFGVAFTMPAATVAALHAVPEGRSGIASGAFSTSRQLGSLIGVAIFGSIVAMSSNFTQGLHIALIISGILFFSGFLLSCFIDTK